MGKKIVVLGGGASGLMAAIAAAQRGAFVTVLEQNEKPGKKILASGNGRCNFTNRDQDPDHYHSSDPEFVNTILSQFTHEQTLKFFKELGIWPRERDGWYYPNSDQAQAVLDVLLFEAARLKVKIKTREHVTGIKVCKDSSFLVTTATWQYPADSLILCMGSSASHVSGSSADGISLAEKLKIRSNPFLPALCPLNVSGKPVNKWGGVRVAGTISLSDETIREEIGRAGGEIQLNDRQISGIPVFQVSYAAVAAKEKGHRVSCLIDFLPAIAREELEEELIRRRGRNPAKSAQDLYIGLLPDKLVKVLVNPGDGIGDSVLKVKECRLIVEGQKDIQSGQAAQGGICPVQLNSHMEFLKIPGLFAAGELIDVNGDCGGYNLQWAWSSGFTAGYYAAEE